MRKTYKYRIYPTKKQERELNTRLESCRMLYNHFLAERKNCWENEKKSVKLYDQINQLPLLKLDILNLKDVYCQALQNVAVRVDLAFQAYFRRCKSGDDPGYPRFKSYGRYDSITYPLYGRGIRIKGGSLNITGIGHVKTVFHRELQGTPKTAIIKRSSTNKWYVSFSCEIENYIPLAKSKLNVGIDVGLETFAYMSDETKIENPRFFKIEEKELSKSQSKRDLLKKGSTERKAMNHKVCRIFERVKWKRDDFSHQESRKIINKYQIIAIEDLNINQIKNKTFKTIKKSIADVAWNKFFELLYAKAEEAGRTVIAVNPAYTSQDCSGCGYRQKKKLSERIHHCKKCGLRMHRDLNASINILSLGLQALGANP